MVRVAKLKNPLPPWRAEPRFGVFSAVEADTLVKPKRKGHWKSTVDLEELEAVATSYLRAS